MDFRFLKLSTKVLRFTCLTASAVSEFGALLFTGL